MAKRQSALGKDFYAILDDNIMGMKEGTATTLRIAEIEPRSDQPRKYFEREALEALADSIAAYGIITQKLHTKHKNARDMKTDFSLPFCLPMKPKDLDKK